MFCCSKFYEREALLRDPVDGPILASLLGMRSIMIFQAYDGQHSYIIEQSSETIALDWLILNFAFRRMRYNLSKGCSRKSLEILFENVL